MKYEFNYKKPMENCKIQFSESRVLLKEYKVSLACMYYKTTHKRVQAPLFAYIEQTKCKNN